MGERTGFGLALCNKLLYIQVLLGLQGTITPLVDHLPFVYYKRSPDNSLRYHLKPLSVYRQATWQICANLLQRISYGCHREFGRAMPNGFIFDRSQTGSEMAEFLQFSPLNELR